MFLKKSSTLLALLSFCVIAFSQNVLTSHDLFQLEQVVEAVISPDGNHIAYTVNHDRPFQDGKGLDYRELHVLNLATGEDRPFITGKNYLRSLAWTPDGKRISFLARMGDVSRTQVFAMHLDGGAPYPLTQVNRGVLAYDWHPSQNQVALISTKPTHKAKSDLRRMGFDAEIYEEGLSERNLYLYDLDTETLEQLTKEGAVYDLAWNPQGDQIAVQIAPQNLVDDSYMFKKIHLVDPATKSVKRLIDNPGKLTAMAWSPDGQHIAFVSAVDISDPVSGSLFVVEANNTKPFSALRNYSKGFEGSVNNVGWKDNETILFTAEESVDLTLSQIGLKKKKRKLLLEGGKVVIASAFYQAGSTLVFTGNTLSHPNELFTFDLENNDLKRQTHHNSWLANKQMGKQVKVSYEARDGLRIDGVLIYPVGYSEGTRYPMITYIHGGPEAAEHNGWQTYYSKWGQVAAGKGFFVFIPNYRASAGRGVEFAKADHMDLGDEEFLDVIDGIEYLSEQGLIDKSRVGMGGGSYGGYFSALAATQYSEHFAASVVFVGISNQVSKRNCTDIPLEDYHVHWRIWTYENPELVYDRSPVKYARDNQTPTLILHGKNDTRVIPTQSLELYRQLKLHGKAPVRLVWYPGEGHGNRNSPAQLDYSLRTMRWFEYYLKGDEDRSEKPPMDIDYGLKQVK